ncbi:hypothetical protein TNCV_3413451 [Trichonephila clavipes]|uniref:Uncharacterized protein n=1 Tax=Trichonephila clavipes TaxID=2585209 RepID=A0A8X6RK09_TRICX|nr:hypothetical protein TNCV_3413411 [Trichonephila clavipes]GFX93981.1 hypothetical protein TNCV_3413431 [Trichonephila clavipes]GFX93983.1 hypothetical protein TNCV_3413451 [Trichonephila clavipes]
MQWPKRSQVVERNSTLKRQNTTENNASKNRSSVDSKFPGVRDTNSSSVVQSSRAEGAVTDFVGYGATKTISP